MRLGDFLGRLFVLVVTLGLIALAVFFFLWIVAIILSLLGVIL